jgi:hypothetical protein
MRVLLLSLWMISLAFGCGRDDKSGDDTGSEADSDDAADDDADDAADADAGADAERSFLMGFTPFPYEASWEALTGVYGLIQDHGDFVAHHFDAGVPWPEALAGTAYNDGLTEELDLRLALTDPSVPAYLALSPFSSLRDELAPYWDGSTSMERTGDWAAATFADPDVRTAYANFSVDLIAHFDPTWFNYGIEVSEYLYNHPDQWDAFVGFAQHVHGVIKAEHPDVKLMVSIGLKHPDSSASETFRARLPDLLPYVDVVGVSVYPYAFFGLEDGGNPANLPESWLSQISAIAPEHPIAIAETAWIAEDMVIDGTTWALDVDGSAEWQAQYVETLCAEAHALDAQFITWWAVTDFDTLWETTLGSDPLAAIWRDTGLYSGDLSPRAALDVWETWRAKPLSD